jgi:hypothetical protein
MTLSTTFFRPLAATCVLLLVLFTGCDSTDSNSTEEISPDETAEMIAVTLAEENGGTADDLTSAQTYAQTLTTGPSAATDDAIKALARSYSRDCQYSDAEQTWTCTVSATRSTDRSQASFDRTVEIQFLGADGQARRAYRVNGEPAATLTYSVLSGSGTFDGPRMSSQHTLPAPGEDATFWTVDTPGTGRLTINGSGSRTVSNGQEGFRGTRTRNATLTTQAADVVVERGEGVQSGTISGTYDATVELTNNSGDSVNRTINVEYVATFTSDTVEITFTGGGERFNGRTFTFSSATAEPV